MTDINWVIHNLFNRAGRGVRPSHDATMLSLALVIAQRSTCRRRSVGCVLTDVNGRVLSMGHNGVAKGMQHCTVNPCIGAQMPSGQGLDLCHAIHAEQNALMFCDDIMKIHTCYTSVSPCMHCLKMLLNTSCERLVFEDVYPHPAAQGLWESAGRKWELFSND